MPRLIPRIAVVLVLLLLLAPPVAAGGWATVQLDAPPGDVAVGVPLRLGFMVLRHGVAPIDLDQVTLTARHRESGETLEADARQNGATGQYVVDVTFPRAGEWKWEIIPDPFTSTSFETLTVRDGARSATGAPGQGLLADFGYSAHVRTGTCQQLGPILYPLRDVASGAAGSEGMSAATTPGVLLATSTTTVAAPLADLVATPQAIDIGRAVRKVTAASPVAISPVRSRTRSWRSAWDSGATRVPPGSPSCAPTATRRG